LLSQGYPQRFAPATLALFAASEDFNPRRAACHGDNGAPIPYARNCIFGSPGAAPDLAVWGDSHGAELLVPLGERLQKEGRAALQITASACPPVLNYPVNDRPHCEAHNAQTLTGLLADPRIKTVVLATNFSGYRHHAYARMLGGYQATVARLRSAGKRVVVVGPIPDLDFDPPALLGIRHAWQQSPMDIGLPVQTYRAVNQEAFSMLSRISSSAQDMVYPQSVLCGAAVCRSYDQSQGVLYFNSNHLSLTGARLLVDAMQL
jgi:hypothetical protein